MGSDHCNDPANEFLPWYLNGSLDPEEAGQVRIHLDQCLICANELSELASVAAHLEARREVGPLPRSAPPAARAGWSFRMGLAAMLVVSALMGGYWIHRRGALRLPGAAGGEAAITSLDLRSGPTRGGESLPTLLLSGKEHLVNLRLTAPVDAEADYELELRTSSGTILTGRPRTRLTLDPLGRATFQFEADLISSPGEFEVRLREFEASGAMHEYIYPFRVAIRP